MSLYHSPSWSIVAVSRVYNVWKSCSAWLFPVSLMEEKAKEEYKEKLESIYGVDPYEIPRNKWIDDFGLWPEVYQIHISMYLLLTPSPYSKEEFLNYKSLDSYINFVSEKFLSRFFMIKE